MEKTDLRIVFFGTPEFAVESLRRLVEGGYNVVGVVTMPDKTGGRGHRLIESDVKRYAAEAGLPVLQPEKLRAPEFLEQLRALKADLQIVIAFRMLPEAVWAMPRLGTFNLHASLLPRYRGAAPINRAVMNGDASTGITTFFLRHEIDTGDVIQQVEVPIGFDDNVGDVHDRLMLLGADLVVSTVDAIIAGTVKAIPQEQLITRDVAPTPAPKIFKEDCHIDCGRSALEVYNHIRGLSPYPGAWCDYCSPDGAVATQLKVLRTGHPEPLPDAQPGSLDFDKHHLWLHCADGRLELLELQPAGKRRMTADEFLRGYDPTACTCR